MLKIKVYDCESEIDLEKKLNNLMQQLEEHDQEIIDIKYQVNHSMYGYEQIYIYSALIMYDDKVSKEYKPKKYEILEKIDWRLNIKEEVNKIWLEKFILNNPFDFKNGIINHCRQMDKLDVYEWIAEDELKINNLQSQLKAKEEVIKEARECVKQIKLHYQQSPTMIPSVKINKLDEILSKGENK